MKVRIFIGQTEKPRLVDFHAVPQKHDLVIVIDETGGRDGAEVTEHRRQLVVEEVIHLALYNGKPDIAAELYCKEV